MTMMKHGGHITERCLTMAFERSCVALAGVDICKQRLLLTFACLHLTRLHAIDYLKSLTKFVIPKFFPDLFVCWLESSFNHNSDLIRQRPLETRSLSVCNKFR
jgi:hypothetical protein